MTPTSPDQTARNGQSDSLAEYIHRRRVELDLTKAEAARRAGLSRRTWHLVETGERTDSTAVTLSQFDQALQLPEGTLWELSAKSTIQAAKTLRQQAIALVRSMNDSELRFFIEHNGAESLQSKVDELTRDHERLKLIVENLTRDLPREQSPQRRRPRSPTKPKVGDGEPTMDRPG